MSQEEMENQAETTEDVSAEEMAEDFGEVTDDSEGTPAKPEQTADESTVKATDEATFDVDGEQVTLEQVRQWKTGGMLKADYTRKTQELAEARRGLEEEAQRRWVDDFYNTSEQPKAVVDKAKDITTGDIEISAEEMAMLDPITRDTYKLAQANRKMLEAYESDKHERQRADTNKYITSTFDGFVAKIEKETGMKHEEAGNLAANISAKTRQLVKQGKVAYCPEALDMVYLSLIHI